MAKIAERLRMVIGDQSVNAWAESVGIAPQTVHDWLTSDRNLRAASLKVLADATGTSEQWWATGEGDPPGSYKREGPAPGAAMKARQNTARYSPGNAPQVSTELLSAIVATVEDFCAENAGRVRLSPDKKATLIAVAYGYFESREFDMSEMRQLFKLVA